MKKIFRKLGWYIYLFLPVIATILVLLPSIASLSINHLEGVEARWKVQYPEGTPEGKEGIIAPDIKFVGTYASDIQKFYEKYDIPLKLTFTQIIVLALILGIFFMAIMFHNEYGYRNFDSDYYMSIYFIFHVITFIIFIILGFVHMEYNDPPQGTFNDTLSHQKLLIEVTEEYMGFYLLSMFMIYPLVVLLIGDIICILFGNLSYVLLHNAGIYLKQYAIERSGNFPLGESIAFFKNNSIIETYHIKARMFWIPFPIVIVRRKLINRNEMTRMLDDRLNLYDGQRFICVSPDGRVEVSRAISSVLDESIPIPLLRRVVETSASLDVFHWILLNGAKDAAFEEVRNKLLSDYRDRYNIGEKSAQKLITHVGNLLTDPAQNGLQEFLRNSIQNGETTLKLASELLQDVSDTTLDKFRTDLLAHISEAFEEIFVKFKKEVSCGICSVSEDLNNFNPDFGDIDVYPQGTKFFFSRSDDKVLIIEQPPQVRTLNFSKRFLNNDLYRNEGGKVSDRDKRLDRSLIHLALPFVVFVIKFYNGVFSKMLIFYRNSPLTSLDDTLFYPNLPNMNDSCEVCLGYSPLENGTLAQKTEHVISHFWNSRFNTDLSSNYFTTPRHEKLKSVWTWEAHSKMDPSFILNVNWSESSTKLRRLVFSLCQSRSLNISVYVERLNQLLEKSVSDVCDHIKVIFESMKVEDRYPKTITNELARFITSLNEQISSLIKERFMKIFEEKKISDDVNLNEEIMKDFGNHVCEIVGDILKEDFSRLAAEVPIRRQFNSQGLIQRIQEVNQTGG